MITKFGKITEKEEVLTQVFYEQVLWVYTSDFEFYFTVTSSLSNYPNKKDTSNKVLLQYDLEKIVINDNDIDHDTMVEIDNLVSVDFDKYSFLLKKGLITYFNNVQRIPYFSKEAKRNKKYIKNLAAEIFEKLGEFLAREEIST